MKKVMVILLIVLALLLNACGTTKEQGSDPEGKQLMIYTTVYPLQYFAERIGGEHVSVASIYPPGSNEHTFEPTQKDMMKLADSDAVFYIGLGLEGFVDGAKESLKNEKVKFVATASAIPESELMAGLDHSEEEHQTDHHEHGGEGTEEHSHDHDGESTEEHHHEEDGTEEHNEEPQHSEHSHAIDPHVWISPVLSKDLAKSIKNELISMDSENAEVYEENYKELISDLDELDQSFRELTDKASQKTFFVSHAAFGYLASTYNLNQVAVAGLNSQDEPSQKKLERIVEQGDNLNIKYIAFEQNVSSKLAEIIQNELGAKAVTLHNLSVLTQEDIINNESYFTLMEKNRNTLELILNEK